MTARSELVARIADSLEALASTSQITPTESVMETDLTLPQLRILYMLASGPARITDISEAFGMARANASTMVERLVRKGLVERDSDPNDRRVALARLTGQGREAVEGVTRSEITVVEKIAKFLTLGELEVVARALEIMNHGVKRLEAAGNDEAAGPNSDG